MRRIDVFVVPAAALGASLFSSGVYGADSLLFLQRQIIGNTVCGKSRGYDTCIHYKEDGTMSGKSTGAYGTYYSKGTYKIRDDGTLCVSWEDPKWDSSCTRMVPSESGHIESIDEKGDVRYTHKSLRPGDAEHLR